MDKTYKVGCTIFMIGFFSQILGVAMDAGWLMMLSTSLLMIGIGIILFTFIWE